ncbi:uncharacterized protein LOC135370208 isoform X1 [Ornithodoros turicata]|uniref:uncharacterized protein LOC135370208 isoform X1 n=1 Tax=Ornithodoros turicata TaxID=34597 RepID=UPI003138CF62
MCSLGTWLCFYSIIVLGTFIAECVATYLIALLTDYHRRPYVYVVYGRNAVIRLINFIAAMMCSSALSSDNMKTFFICTILIGAKIVGNVMYGVSNFVYENFVMSPGVLDGFKDQYTIMNMSASHRLISIALWTAIEGPLLYMMLNYYSQRMSILYPPAAPPPPPMKPAEDEDQGGGDDDQTERSTTVVD